MHEYRGTFFGAPDYDAPGDAAQNKGPLFQALVSQAARQPPLMFGQSNVAQTLMPGSDPTAGMSGWDKLVAGIGSGMSGGALDATRLMSDMGLPGTPQFMQSPEVTAAYKQAIKNKKKIDKALLDTDEGKLGNLAGDAAVTGLIPRP